MSLSFTRFSSENESLMSIQLNRCCHRTINEFAPWIPSVLPNDVLLLNCEFSDLYSISTTTVTTRTRMVEPHRSCCIVELLTARRDSMKAILARWRNDPAELPHLAALTINITDPEHSQVVGEEAEDVQQLLHELSTGYASIGISCQADCDCPRFNVDNEKQCVLRTAGRG